MNVDRSRRDFLLTASQAMTGLWGLPGLVPGRGSVSRRSGNGSEPTPSSGRMTTCVSRDQLAIQLHGKTILAYQTSASQKYPYVYPLAGPITGRSLTSESAEPYPHHHSLFFGCDPLNGGNYWHDEGGERRIRSLGPRALRTGRRVSVIEDRCDWTGSKGTLVMRDIRRIELRLVDSFTRYVDWDIQWSALQNIKVPKTNHSLFSLRAAADLLPKAGGILTNAEGRSGESGTFGKPSGWCAFVAPRPGLPPGMVEGIALMDHPRNPWSPCPWFTRDYGFISPTPFWFIDKPWTLEAGRTLRLRYRVALFACPANQLPLSRLYREWLV